MGGGAGFGADRFDDVAELRGREGGDVVKAHWRVGRGDFRRRAAKASEDEHRGLIRRCNGAVGGATGDGVAFFQKGADGGVAVGGGERGSAGAFVEEDAEGGGGEAHAVAGWGVSAAVTLPVGRLGRSSSERSAATVSSALSVRMFSTSVASGRSGALAW